MNELLTECLTAWLIALWPKSQFVVSPLDHCAYTDREMFGSHLIVNRRLPRGFAWELNDGWKRVDLHGQLDLQHLRRTNRRASIVRRGIVLRLEFELRLQKLREIEARKEMKAAEKERLREQARRRAEYRIAWKRIERIERLRALVFGNTLFLAGPEPIELGGRRDTWMEWTLEQQYDEFRRR